MSAINSIIDEFEMIAVGDDSDPNSTGMVGIESFAYDYPIAMNTKRDREYPLLLASKEHPASDPEFNKKNRQYSIKLMFLDLFQHKEQTEKEHQAKLAEMELLADEYLREFRKRALGQTTEVTTIQEWFLIEDSVEIEHLHRVGNDELIGVEINMRVQLFTSCAEGTFNY